MNWNEISSRYSNMGKNLIEKTNEGTSGCKDGMGNDSQDFSDIRRTHKVLLRMGFEFLVKALYLKKGWNIYQFRINPLIRFEQLSQINESNLNLNRTIDFKILIDNLDSILTNTLDLSGLKTKLNEIREEGNKAVHSDTVNTIEIDGIKKLKDEIVGLLT